MENVHCHAEKFQPAVANGAEENGNVHHGGREDAGLVLSDVKRVGGW